MVTFGDETTTINNTRKQVALKKLARKTPETRDTLKSLWNITPDGTISHYSPTTITPDTNTRKNTVIRKNDLAIVNETKPRLMQIVACKTVREYNRNQEKIKQLLLTEKRRAKQSQQRHQLERPECMYNASELHYPNEPGPSHKLYIPGPGKRKPQQRKRKPQPTKRPQKPISAFDRKSKEAAIAQTKLNKAMQHQRQKFRSPRIQLDTAKLQANKSIEVINLVSDSSRGSPMTIYTSNDPTAFMTTSAKKNTRNKDPVNRKSDKIINRIIHSPTKHHHENTQQRITITPADNTSPIAELMSIIPAHQSTPFGHNFT